jgi:WD40 repeat protein
MAVANKKHVSLLDVRERQEVHRFECNAYAYRPTYSPDGKFIAASDGHGKVHVWNVDNGKDSTAKPFRTWCRDSVVFSPIVDLVAATTDEHTVSFLDAEAGLEVKKLSFPEGAPCPFFFTPDGKTLVGGAEGNPLVHMWDADTGKELRRWDLTSILDREGL